MLGERAAMHVGSVLAACWMNVDCSGMLYDAGSLMSVLGGFGIAATAHR